MGQSGTVDTSQFTDAYVLILNSEQHNSPEGCSFTHWSLQVADGTGTTPAIADSTVWNASNFEPAAQVAGIEVFTGRADSRRFIDYYSILNLRAGDVVTVTAEATSGVVDTVIDIAPLEDLSDILLTDDDGGEGTNSRFTFEIPSSGDYAVSMYPYGDPNGEFRVVIECAIQRGCSGCE